MTKVFHCFVPPAAGAWRHVAALRHLHSPVLCTIASPAPRLAGTAALPHCLMLEILPLPFKPLGFAKMPLLLSYFERNFSEKFQGAKEERNQREKELSSCTIRFLLRHAAGVNLFYGHLELVLFHTCSTPVFKRHIIMIGSAKMEFHPRLNCTFGLFIFCPS